MTTAYEREQMEWTREVANWELATKAWRSVAEIYKCQLDEKYNAEITRLAAITNLEK